MTSEYSDDQYEQGELIKSIRLASDQTQYQLEDSLDNGVYEITVYAEKTKDGKLIKSPPGTHTIVVNSELENTPTPTPIEDTPCIDVVHFLEDYSDYCPDQEDSVAIKWWNQCVRYFVCAYYGEFGYNGYTNFKSIQNVPRNNTYLHSPSIIFNEVPEKRPNKFVFATTQFNAVRKETGARVDVKFEWDVEKIQEFVNQGFGQFDPDIGSVCNISDLAIPEPTTETPTKNAKVAWSWPPVKPATEYIISMERISKSESTTAPGWIVQEDFGIRDTVKESTTEQEFRRSGYYRISVVAKYKEIESLPGTHIAEVDLSLNPPVPTTKTPTNDRTVIWNWDEVPNAENYDVNMEMLKVSESSGTPGWIVDHDFGKVASSKKTSFTFNFLLDGYFRIKVIANNLSDTSEPGEHIVKVDTTMKPPQPSADTPTNKFKINWAWGVVENADSYEVSLAEVTKSQNPMDAGEYVVQQNIGETSETDETYFEFTFEKSGYYQISVLGKNKYNESEIGTHVVFIDTSLVAPEPKAKTPTADTTILWTWRAVPHATKYKVDLHRVIKSTNVATGIDSWDIDTKIGRTKITSSTEYEVTIGKSANYELTVVAVNDEMESDPGTHVVEVDTTLTPTPTPIPTPTPTPTPSPEIYPNPFEKPISYLDKTSIFYPNCSPINFVSSEWYINVGQWVVAEDFRTNTPGQRFKVSRKHPEKWQQELDTTESRKDFYNIKVWPEFNFEVYYNCKTGNPHNMNESCDVSSYADGSSIRDLAIEYGFGLSDSSKTLDELCDNYWNDTPTPTITPTLTSTIIPTPTPTQTEVLDKPKYRNSYLYLEDEDDYCPDNSILACSNWWKKALGECIKKYEDLENAKLAEKSVGALVSINLSGFIIAQYVGLMLRNDFHNPQNVSSSIYPRDTDGFTEDGTPMDIVVVKSIITANGARPAGYDHIAWSDLYPFWQEIGYARFDPRKGEKCPT